MEIWLKLFPNVRTAKWIQQWCSWVLAFQRLLAAPVSFYKAHRSTKHHICLHWTFFAFNSAHKILGAGTLRERQLDAFRLSVVNHKVPSELRGAKEHFVDTPFHTFWTNQDQALEVEYCPNPDRKDQNFWAGISQKVFTQNIMQIQNEKLDLGQ